MYQSSESIDKNSNAFNLDFSFFNWHFTYWALCVILIQQQFAELKFQGAYFNKAIQT
jgi:hypothetical protein